MATRTRSGSEVSRMRTASIERSAVPLRHPLPDLQSIQGAYVQNVERLEERAERMSMGSDIGEEIRKLQLEQKLSDSRRASLFSNAAVDPAPRSRNPSMSSYANSIVEVNGAARYGGYSPAAFVGSPIGSLRSGSWSQVSHGAANSNNNPLSRSISNSRLGQLSSSHYDYGTAHSPIDDPTIQVSAFRHSNRSSFSDQEEDSRNRRMKRVSIGRLPSNGSFSRLYNEIAETQSSAAHLAAARIPSDTSFTDLYNQIAGEIHTQLDMSLDGVSSRLTNGSVQVTPMDELSRQLGDVTSAPRAEENKNTPPPQPPRHAHIQTHVEGPELDLGFTIVPKSAEKESPDGNIGRQNANPAYADNIGPPRPSSAASGDTFQQAQILFQDFDGAHYAPSIRGSTRLPSGDVSEVLDDGTSILKNLDPLPNSLVPPPRDGMVFYPAPVPRMLNLPQRLSQLPSAAIQAKRRSQMMDALPMENRKSAAWMDHERQQSGGDPRMSKMNLASLPPQLRASMFFEHQSKREEVEIRDQSAMATLEDLLDASARAPVSAFTHHPIAGPAGAGVYKKENAHRSSASLQRLQEKKEGKALADVEEEPGKKAKPRGSFLGLRRSSVSSANALDEEGSKTPNKLRKRSSVNMLDDSALTRGPNGEIGEHTRSGASTPLHPRLNENGERVASDDEEAVGEEEKFESHEAEEDENLEEEEEEIAGAPTTLLAELQRRKAQQKLRGRTAVQAYPNGMHSTLLELDAVAQLEKQKRKKTRVALAWEDPSVRVAEEAEQDDEDVPLGMLFSNKSALVKQRLAEQGLAEWDRPLGLLERRQMEDNEPLSRRRNRLLGINPNAPVKQPPVPIIQPEEESEESEHESETLAQRLRRLKEKKTLTDAIGNVDDKRVSNAFSMDLLSSLGVGFGEVDEKPKSNVSLPKSPGLGDFDRDQTGTPGDDETLAQRRARLQREALENAQRASQMNLGANDQWNTNFPSANPPVNAAGPRMSMMYQGVDSRSSVMLNPSRSMADLLSAYPIGEREQRKITNVTMFDFLAANTYPTSAQNNARRVHNDLLVAQLPEESLLAKNEDAHRKRRSYIKLAGDAGLEGQRTPPFDQQRPSLDRRQSHTPPGARRPKPEKRHSGMNGLVSQIPYGNGMPPQPPSSIGGVGLGMNGFANMSNPNFGVMGGYQHMNLGPNGQLAMNQPNLISPLMGNMSTPNLQGGYVYGGNVAQQMSYGRMTGYMGRNETLMQEAPIDTGTRQRVDAWRQGVMP